MTNSRYPTYVSDKTKSTTLIRSVLRQIRSIQCGEQVRMLGFVKGSSLFDLLLHLTIGTVRLKILSVSVRDNQNLRISVRDDENLEKRCHLGHDVRVKYRNYSTP